jgi:hypothetical protein
MNRRNFLRLSSGLIVASQVAPSLIWPFRKFFIPNPIEPVIVGNGMFMYGAGASEFERVLSEELYRIWDQVFSSQLKNVRFAREKMGPAIIENPAGTSIFDYPEQVKAQDPETYRILYGNASTDRA